MVKCDSKYDIRVKNALKSVANVKKYGIIKENTDSEEWFRMKELKPSTKLDGTPEENERAIQRIIDSLTEEEITEAMSDKYAYLDED